MRPGIVDERAPDVSPDRMAVAAPRSCASFNVRRIRSRSAGGQPLQRGRFDVDGGPFDAELAREPCRAAHDVVAPGPGPTQHSSDASVFHTRLDRLVRAVGLDIVFDPVGGAAQRELAQRHQIALAEEVARRALDLLGNVDLAGLEAREQVVGRDVDQHHLVGIVEDRVGHRLPDGDAGDAADDVVQAFEMLDVEAREDVDAARQQLVDVLPALRVARPRRVGMRELVDEDQRRVAL